MTSQSQQLDRYFTGNKDSIILLTLAKQYFNRGSHALEPFAGTNSIVYADKSNHFRWTTNDIVFNKFLDMNLDYLDIPVKKYDLVITNPPFKGGNDNLIKILNHFGKYTENIFCIVMASHLRKRDLQKIFDNKWLVLEDLSSTNTFWCESERKNKSIRCRIIHFQKTSIPIRHLCSNPVIVQIKNDVNNADFHVSYMATDVGRFVADAYPYKKISFSIKDAGLKEFTKKNHFKLGQMMHQYAKTYSATMYKIDFYEINHFITSFYFASNFQKFAKNIPFLKLKKLQA